MLVGLDLDNTIVNYESAISRLADLYLDLPIELPKTKPAIRHYLRTVDREKEWTAFQGELYGPGMAYAEPFFGCVEALMELRTSGFGLCIVSHRTREPYVGPAYDLHQYATKWLEGHFVRRGIIKTEEILLKETRGEKVRTIKSLGCSFFLDDLPEIFDHREFPHFTLPVLFDPYSSSAGEEGFKRAHDWHEFLEIVKSSSE